MSTGPLHELLSSLGYSSEVAASGAAIPAPREIGFYHPLLPHRIQVLGSAADAGGLDSPWQSTLPQLIIIGSDARADVWQARAAALALPCYRSSQPSPAVVDRLRAAVTVCAAPHQYLHATLVRVLDLGVLLQGASGSGKSELALDLVSRGHPFVADDAVDISRPAAGCLLGECPAPLQGFIEVRGLGIIDLRAAYGDAAIAARSRIDLAIRIEHAELQWEAQDRLHGRRKRLDILGVAIPEILLPARLGHNAVMVEAACRDHWLRLNGYVGSEAFVAAHGRRLTQD
jgi:HPr kinase/phosphorylase